MWRSQSELQKEQVRLEDGGEHGGSDVDSRCFLLHKEERLWNDSWRGRSDQGVLLKKGHRES
jgi:hypothetical protein